MGRLCYPTPHRVKSWYFSQKAVTMQGGYGACFCRHGTNFIACWRDRGTSLIGAANLSPVTNLVAGTGAVSRYKLSRRQKFITVQNFNCVQMRVSGCNGHYKFVLSAGAKAKTVTNNLPILSVLYLGLVKSFCLRYIVSTSQFFCLGCNLSSGNIFEVFLSVLYLNLSNIFYGNCLGNRRNKS
jgi:hypothetical protein